MSFHDNLYKLINEYADVYKTVYQTQNYKHPFGAFVRHDIVQSLTPIVDTNKYLIKGSCGAGRYTTVPWIAVFDRRITTSAQKGVYIVYLLNKDTKELYLTLNQGATDASSSSGKLAFTGVAGISSSKVLAKLRENAAAIRKIVGNIPFNTDNNIKCGSDNYDAGAICYKKYTLETLPDDKELESDLSRLIEVYDKYADWYLHKDIKGDFFKFLGPVDSLNGYQKSYKLVLYKVMFDLMDDNGICSSEEVAKSFRQFYVDRVNVGKISDVDVDKRIEFIKDSTIKDVYNVICANPFKAIRDKGFMFKTNENLEKEKICFDEKLIKQLSAEEIYEIKYIIDRKLEMYYSEIDDISHQKTWLLSWNPNNWTWEDFDEAVDLVTIGEDYEMGWSCSSKKINPGDRVFLTILGSGEQNGIIASGVAISNTYESEHWDDVKREKGQTSNYIDVRFDCIRDYKNEKYLLHSKLKSLFPEQQWSPMASGISIRDEYCEDLEREWNAISKSDNVSLEEKFNLWIKWQPQRKAPALTYSEGTIDAMVSILRRGSAAFDSNDTSISNCFTIINPKEFDSFSQKFSNKAKQLDKKYGHSDYRNALFFYNKFLTVQSVEGMDYSKITDIVDAYEKNFDVIFEGEKYKIEALEQFNKYWDINSTDFAAMLEKSLAKSNNLLTSGNYFAYKGIVEFAQAKPEAVRALFKRLYNPTEDFVVCAYDFKSESAEYFDSLGLSTYQDLHAVSVYAFFKYPHKYCIYKSSFYDNFAKRIGFNPAKDNTGYNTSRIKNNDTLFDAVKYVLSTHSQNLIEKFIQKEQECSLDKISLNYWAFDVIHSIRYEITESEDEEGGKEMTTKEKIAVIKNYIAAKGFNYESNLIENFYLSLKSKPFVILAGTSGTGKTRLVKLFAEAIGAEMKLVPVRPDWSDSSDLFGHTDLNNNFHPGAILEFIKKAEWNKDKPFFLCLDEMNLARVEYYLSDFLSIIETRDRKDNGDIETDALIDVDYYKNKEAQGKYGRVFIPENLYIIGTVNMDETTFPFSKKVLDRANTIEFSFVNLMAKPAEIFVDKPQPLSESNSFLRTEYLYLSECDDTDLVKSICFDLEELNSILVKANLHVGYRVRDEISFYMMNNKNSDLIDVNAAFDNEIMQKILPRIQGSSRAIKDVLSELFKKFAGDYTGLAGATDFEQMQSYIDAAKDCKYPNSAKKIAFMMRRYEEDGFTSYWL